MRGLNPTNFGQAFINLQYELAGSKNRIAVERMRYNQAVHNYNQTYSTIS